MRLALTLAALVVAAEPAVADDDQLIRSAATVLALTMQTDGEIVVDSPEHAHLSGTTIVFERKSDCVYVERIKSLGGDRFLLVDFNKLGSGYGYAGGELLISGRPTERQAACFQYDSAGIRCSGSLHVQRGVDEKLLISSVHYTQQHGCGQAAQ